MRKLRDLDFYRLNTQCDVIKKISGGHKNPFNTEKQDT